MRVRIDKSRILYNGLIYLDHLAGKGCEDIGGRLHRFDDGCAVTLREFGTDIRQLHKNNVAEELRRVRGDAYGRDLSIELKPFMDAYREEFFGPVGVVYRVSGEDEAVKVANDTSYGLGSYVFTTDPEQAERVANKIDAGMVYVNVVLADSPELPFGGVKRSGTSREMGLLAADEFVNKKLIRIGA